MVNPFPWQRKLDIVRYCNENGIAVMAYSPLVKGKKFEDETLLQIAKRDMTLIYIYT
jgi:diketogulonate reductase-like aldo/keto reductase